MGGNQKKMLWNVFRGFPSWYANNVPASRRVWMYIGNQKNVSPPFMLKIWQIQVLYGYFIKSKLDGVGPIDNPPAISFTTLSEKNKKINDLWYMTRDMWNLTRDTTLDMKCDTWHVTHDMWHVWGGEHSLKISAP